MKSPPIHSGKITDRDYLIAGAQLLSKSPASQNHAQLLRPGHLTALTGSSLYRRKNYVAGLTHLHPRSSTQPIFWFTRYWTLPEIVKSLLIFQIGLHGRSVAESEQEHIARAIQVVQELGVHFETTHRSISEVGGFIDRQLANQSPRLVIVDGIEHFRASPQAHRSTEAIPAAIELLKDAAKRYEFALLVTCLPPASDWSDAVIAAANEVIAITGADEN